MKRKTRYRITAMAMAVIMAAAAFQTGSAGSIVNAAGVLKENVKFPDVYTLDLIQPEDNDEIVNKKVEALIRTMTTEEKYTFLGGNGTGDKEGNAGYLKGVPRLGVPMIKMYDGPAGVLYTQDTTNPPQEQMLAATWNQEMAQKYGEAIGLENLSIGGCFLLGAQVDIQRIPQFQRTKDQMGEDSYLLSSMADDLTEGMQEYGGVAVLKHYTAFTQNASPATNTNDVVSEQALHETYLPGFETAIKDGGALGLMSSYSKVNGTAVSSSSYLLEDVLRDMWGYEGFTITDWGANTEYSLDKGMEIEMPSLSKNSQKNTEEKVANGEMTQAEADEMVDTALKHILYAYGKGGYLTLVEVDKDGYAKEEAGRTDLINPGTDNDALADLYDSSNAAVQEVAEEGGVLLKNEKDTLPLNTKGNNTVAVVGLNGMHLIPGEGGERSYGSIKAMTSPYKALTEILGEDKVEGQVYEDVLGTIIPKENLYTSLEGNEHGAKRTYGVQGASGGSGWDQGQMWGSGLVTTPYKDYEIGTECTTDDEINFNTGTVNGEPNKTYFNSEDGTAFSYTDDPSYTWTTYVEAAEDGTHELIFQSIGANSQMTVYSVAEDGTETKMGSASGPRGSQGAQWYSSIVPTETGESLSSVNVDLEKGKRYKVVIASYSNVDNKDMQVGLAWITPSQKQANIDNAVKAAEENDTVVIFAYAQVSDPDTGNSMMGQAGEPGKREDCTLKLDDDQQEMILKVAKAAHAKGNKVAVVLNNDSQVVMEDWIDEADAILEMYFPGQRGGVATARLLTGEVNPSGKLAFTIPKKDTDTIITYSDEAWNNYIVADENGNTTTYEEGINTGYRWFDEMGIEPQYDFGHGLSYTTFAYGDMTVVEKAEEGEKVGFDVSFTVTNTGDVTGSEVAQIYLGEAQVPEGIQTSKYQLAGYEKVKDLKPGETRNVTIHVSERSLSYWNSNLEALNVNSDGTKDKWTVAEGSRTIYVGAASDNLLLNATVEVKEKATQADLDKATAEAQAAKEKAEAAKKEAEKAQAAAKEAEEKAQAAKKEAEAAEERAEAAKKEAQAAAEEARQMAAAEQKKAEEAIAKAQAAQAAADKAQAAVEELKNSIGKQKPVPEVGKTATVGSLKYQVTKSNATTGTVKVTGLKSKSIKSVVIPKTVKIGGYTFKVTAIGTNAFKNCKKLKKVTIKSTAIKTVGKGAFKNISKKATIMVPASKFSSYKKLLKKSGLASTVKIKKA